MNKNNKSATKSSTPKSVGRPAFNLKFPRGAFTIAQLFELNKATVKWSLTIRQHVEKELAKGFLTKLTETVKTGKVGKPAHKFIRTAVLAGVKARKEGATPTKSPTEVPVNTLVETPAEVPVGVEASTEAPAQVDSITITL